MRHKAFLLILLASTIFFLINTSGKSIDDKGLNKEKCTYNGIPLHGKVKIVESFPDIKVQVVESFPDINVKIVSNFPDDCGEWQMVESFPDFKIQFVTSFPDIKIRFVESFPGIKNN